MRMRNPKYMNDVLNNCDFYYDLKNGFNNNKPIMLEIGMGKGDFILNMALNHPENNYIGIEKYSSVASVAIKKITPYKLNNLKILVTDAKNLEEYFSNNIDTIYLNFSDPWPKKRNYKRRLTHENYLHIYDKLFKSNAHIIMKTDNIDLFNWSKISFLDYGYKIVKETDDINKLNVEDIETEYEKKFKSIGVKINYIEVIK